MNPCVRPCSPCAAIALTVLGLNLLGDGLRDLLDQNRLSLLSCNQAVILTVGSGAATLALASESSVRRLGDKDTR